MFKNIMQEILIMLLLLFAVSLILGIIFYDYIPKNKTVPIKIKEYAMPEDIKEELGATVIEEQKIVKTLFIDSRDLNLYEFSKEYDKGKANPFKDYGENEEVENTVGDNQEKGAKENQEGEIYGGSYSKGKNK